MILSSRSRLFALLVGAAAALEAASGCSQALPVAEHIQELASAVDGTIPTGCSVEQSDRDAKPFPNFSFFHAEDHIACYDPRPDYRGAWAAYKKNFDDAQFKWVKLTKYNFFEPAVGDVDGDNIADIYGALDTNEVGYASPEGKGFQAIEGIGGGVFNVTGVADNHKIIAFRSWDVDGDGYRDLIAIRRDWTMTVALLEPIFEQIKVNGKVTGLTPARRVRIKQGTAPKDLAAQGAPGFTPTRAVVGKMISYVNVPDLPFRVAVIGVDGAGTPISTIQFGTIDWNGGKAVYDASISGAPGTYHMAIARIIDIALTDEPQGGRLYGMGRVTRPNIGSDNLSHVIGPISTASNEGGLYRIGNDWRGEPRDQASTQMYHNEKAIDSVRLAVNINYRTKHDSGGNTINEQATRLVIRVNGTAYMWTVGMMNGAWVNGWQTADCASWVAVHDFSGMRETLQYTGTADSATVAPYAFKPQALLIPPPCWGEYQACGNQEAANAGVVAFQKHFSAGTGQSASTTTTSSVTYARHYGVAANVHGPTGNGSFGVSADFDDTWTSLIRASKSTSQDWGLSADYFWRGPEPIVVYEQTCAINYWYLHRRGHKRDDFAQFNPMSAKSQDLFVATRVKPVGTVLTTAKLTDYNIAVARQRPEYMIGICSDMTVGADGVPEPKELVKCDPKNVVVPHVFGVPWTYYRYPADSYGASAFPTLNGWLLTDGAKSQGVIHPALQDAINSGQGGGWLQGLLMSSAAVESGSFSVDRHTQEGAGKGGGHDKSEGFRVDTTIPVGVNFMGYGADISVSLAGGRTTHEGVTTDKETFTSQRSGFGASVTIPFLHTADMSRFRMWDWQNIIAVTDTSQREYTQTQMRVFPYVYHWTMSSGGQVVVVDYKIKPASDLWAYPYRWKWDDCENRVQDTSDGTQGAGVGATYRVGGRYCDVPNGSRIILATRSFGGIVVEQCKGTEVCAVPMKSVNDVDIPLWGSAKCAPPGVICRP